MVPAASSPALSVFRVMPSPLQVVCLAFLVAAPVTLTYSLNVILAYLVSTSTPSMFVKLVPLTVNTAFPSVVWAVLKVTTLISRPGNANSSVQLLALLVLHLQ